MADNSTERRQSMGSNTTGTQGFKNIVLHWT